MRFLESPSRRAGRSRSGVDLLPVGLRAGDLDAARLRLFGDRDAQGQDAGLVVGLDVVGVEGVAEEELAREDAEGAFGDLHLDVVAAGQGPPFGLDGQDVALDVELDGVLRDAGQVEADDELVAGAVGVHRHRGRLGPGAGAAEDLLGEAVELAEGVGAHQHRSPPVRHRGVNTHHCSNMSSER
jgi:hypothetical protein